MIWMHMTMALASSSRAIQTKSCLDISLNLGPRQASSFAPSLLHNRLTLRAPRSCSFGSRSAFNRRDERRSEFLKRRCRVEPSAWRCPNCWLSCQHRAAFCSAIGKSSKARPSKSECSKRSLDCSTKWWHHGRASTNTNPRYRELQSTC